MKLAKWIKLYNHHQNVIHSISIFFVLKMFLPDICTQLPPSYSLVIVTQDVPLLEFTRNSSSFCDLSMLVNILVVGCFYYWLGSHLMYINRLFLCIYKLMDVWAVPSFRLSRIMLLWTSLWTCLHNCWVNT